jgi:ribose 5-phosphate isomerase A
LKPNEKWIEEAKKNAAREAVKHLKDGFIVGLGSGSTTAYAIEEIGKRIEREGIKVLGVPTSYQAFMLAVKNKIPITTLEEHPNPDLTIDGADQIDDHLNLIKGMGGALLKEKILAKASKELVIIADERKQVKTLGENNHPVPMEVIPFSVPLVIDNIKKLGGKPVLREGIKKVGPVITDNNNIIIDAEFGLIHDPKELENKLKVITGVVDVGIFSNIAKYVYIGKRSGVEKLVR